MKRQIAVGTSGKRLGEDSGRAKLTNSEVDLIRALHADHGLTYPSLADKFEVSVSLIGKICRYQRRAEVASEWRTLND